jgi:hypothetical protein
MRENKFKPIEKCFIEILEKESKLIDAEFSDVICFVDIFFPPNDEPKHGYFRIGLECTLNKADFDKTDMLYIGIDVNDHENSFEINADLSWGQPLSETVESVFSKPVDVTENNLLKIKEKLPFMFAKLREMIRDNPNGK